ncbi:MAG: TIM-barrel domain-containing protein [Rhodanobacter sp.]
MSRMPGNVCAALLVIGLSAGCSGKAATPAPSAATAVTPTKASFHKLADGVIVDVAGTTSKVRLQVVDERIIHVTAIPAGGFDLPASLMAVKTGGDTRFSVDSDAGHLNLKTAQLTAQVTIATGAVQFFGKDGQLILAEQPHGRTFTPVTVQKQAFYAVRQQFASPDDEAFYGLGQHQQGTMNYKGKDVELAQHNMDIAIPFVVSSRHYGLLWDNNSITRFGDPRPYQMLDKQLHLFDADGKPGGFTANYYLDGKLKLSRIESELNYQYNKDLKRWPASLQDSKGVTGGPGQTVEWKGEVSSEIAGRHKFRLYASGYFKLYVDNKLVLDDWRQNWNPWYRDFFVQMKPGEKHAIRIEWTPQSGYIALDHQNPLPATEQNELSLFSELGHAVDYYFIDGANLDDVIAGYREVTGKAVMLPRWAYGFWQSRDHYETQEQLLDTVARYRKLGLPLDNIVQDWRYWKDDAWGSHQFDTSRYPDAKAMIAKVHAEHAHFMISVWPKFYPTTKNYQELEAGGHIYQHSIEEGVKDWVGPGYLSSFYDPYSSQAREIYWRQMRENLGDLGVDAWWLDATEPDVVSNTSIAERELLMGPTALGPSAAFFNSYPLMTTSAVYQGSRKAYPDKRVFILTRSAFAGQQRNAAASWSGDVVARWSNLRDQISAGINFSLSGIPNWTTDIGGYAVEDRYMKPDAKSLSEWRELNLRWFQFGAFSPIFRSHGQGVDREIYNLAPVGSDVYNALAWYDQLRYRLMPYTYTLAANTWFKDGTIMRGLVMDFPNDAKVRDIDDEYMFGPDFLVAPVTAYEARSRAVYLPAGSDWYDFNSGKQYAGGQTLQAPAPLARMPLFVRAGAIVPTGPAEQYTGEKPDAPITLLIYTGANGHFSLYEDAGTTYGYEQGHYARIPMSYDDAAGALTLGKREGDGQGAPAKREFIIRRINPAHPDADALNGIHDQHVEYDGNELKVSR